MTKKPLGVLLLHGWTATPAHVSKMIPNLETISLPYGIPTLTGHAEESPEAMAGVFWPEWIEDAKKALFELEAQVEKVILVGHSMGGWISLHLSIEYSDLIDSVVIAGASTRLTSPLGPFKPLHFLTPLLIKLISKWNLPPEFADPDLAKHESTYPWVPMDVFSTFFDFIKVTDEKLPEVTKPIKVIHSRNDNANMPEGAELMYHRISTPPELKELVWFEKTDHEMFLDCEAAQVIESVMEFIEQRLELATSA